MTPHCNTIAEMPRHPQSHIRRRRSDLGELGPCIYQASFLVASDSAVAFLECFFEEKCFDFCFACKFPFSSSGC